VFNVVIEIFSATKQPTTNIYFSKICKIKLATSQWVTSPNELIQKMAEKMLTKFDKYWDVIHDIMELLLFWILGIKWSCFNIIMINCMNMTLLIKLGRLDSYVMTWFLIIK